MSKILALTGGVGGAKLALGLSKVLPPDELVFAVNTGDDLSTWGHTSVLISIADLCSVATEQYGNWLGRAGESWNFIETLGP